MEFEVGSTFPISETLPVLRPMHRTFFSHVIFNSTPRQSVCVFPGIFLKTYIKIIKQKIFNFVDIKRTKNILNIFRRYRLLNFFVHINGFLIVVSYSVLLSLTKCQSKSPPKKGRDAAIAESNLPNSNYLAVIEFKSYENRTSWKIVWPDFP